MAEKLYRIALFACYKRSLLTNLRAFKTIDVINFVYDPIAISSNYFVTDETYNILIHFKSSCDTKNRIRQSSLEAIKKADETQPKGMGQTMSLLNYLLEISVMVGASSVSCLYQGKIRTLYKILFNITWNG